MIALLAPLLAALIPIHGIVLASLADRTAIVRTDAVVGMLPAQTRRYRFMPAASFVPGTTIDAFLDSRELPPMLRDAIAAAAFAPGLPDTARVVPLRERADGGTQLGLQRPNPAAVFCLHALSRSHALSRD
jgi:hypothetical protein